MVETISRDDAALDVDEGVPPPEAAPAATAPASPTTPSPGNPNVRRNAAIGATTGFLVTVVAVAVGCALGGMAPTSALGLGVFVGGWGGAAFGFMLATAISLVGHTDPPRLVATATTSEASA